MLIQPGQKISYDAETGKSKVEEVDIEREIGWKDGKIVLEDCPLQEALDILSKKYHVTFRIINDELQNSRFTGTIKNQGVEQIIKNLSISAPPIVTAGLPFSVDKVAVYVYLYPASKPAPTRN